MITINCVLRIISFVVMRARCYVLRTACCLWRVVYCVVFGMCRVECCVVLGCAHVCSVNIVSRSLCALCVECCVLCVAYSGCVFIACCDMFAACCVLCACPASWIFLVVLFITHLLCFPLSSCRACCMLHVV